MPNRLQALQVRSDALGDMNDELITGVMPHAVVDQLKVVQIDKKNGALGVALLGLEERLRQELPEVLPVGQAGESIVGGVVEELILGDLPFDGATKLDADLGQEGEQGGIFVLDPGAVELKQGDDLLADDYRKGEGGPELTGGAEFPAVGVALGGEVPDPERLSGGQDAPRPAVIGDEAPLFDEVAEFSKGRGEIVVPDAGRAQRAGGGELVIEVDVPDLPARMVADTRHREAQGLGDGRGVISGIGNRDEETQLLLGLVEFAQTLFGEDFGRKPGLMLPLDTAG
jgi:hypothetical protein